MLSREEIAGGKKVKTAKGEFKYGGTPREVF